MSIHDSGMPLVDLTHDGEEARPSGGVKDEPVDEDANGAVKDEPRRRGRRPSRHAGHRRR
jgi:hypothetical protein